MNTLIVYESEYGNTERVARAIGTELGKFGAARLVSVGDGAGLDLSGVDLLLMGGPTQGHGATRRMRSWLEGVPETALRGIAAAAFDTRVHWPELLSGSAAHGIAKALDHRGARNVMPPESFFVSGREGPLMDGEIDRAAVWAAALGAKVATEPAPEARPAGPGG